MAQQHQQQQQLESLPEWKDYYLVLYFALAFPLVRWLLDRYLYQSLARRLTDSSPNKAKVTNKSTESMWKLTYYLAAELFALHATGWEPWFANSVAYWDKWPNQTMKFQLKLFYTSQCGFYVYSVAALLVWETRRKDFNVMMSHHLVTIALIATSYISGCFRAGSLVLAIHDASDVFLESAKLLKYSGREVGASVLFGFFALSWLVLRLVYFPFWIIWSTSYQSTRYADLTQDNIVVLYYFVNTLLYSLLVIHIYWWVLICRMMFRQLQNNGKVGEDVRSDTEDE